MPIIDSTVVNAPSFDTYTYKAYDIAYDTESYLYTRGNGDYESFIEIPIPNATVMDSAILSLRYYFNDDSFASSLNIQEYNSDGITYPITGANKGQLTYGASQDYGSLSYDADYYIHFDITTFVVNAINAGESTVKLKLRYGTSSEDLYFYAYEASLFNSNPYVTYEWSEELQPPSITTVSPLSTVLHHTWDAVNGADGYKIYSDSDCTNEISDTTSTEFIQDNLTPNTLQPSIYIKSYTIDESSDKVVSNDYTASTQTNTLGDVPVPTGLGTSDITDNSITWTWTKPDDTSITNYQLVEKFDDETISFKKEVGNLDSVLESDLPYSTNVTRSIRAVRRFRTYPDEISVPSSPYTAQTLQRETGIKTTQLSTDNDAYATINGSNPPNLLGNYDYLNVGYNTSFMYVYRTFFHFNFPLYKSVVSAIFNYTTNTVKDINSEIANCTNTSNFSEYDSNSSIVYLSDALSKSIDITSLISSNTTSWFTIKREIEQTSTTDLEQIKSKEVGIPATIDFEYEMLPAPPVPSTFASQIINSTTVKWSWSQSTDATEYRIYDEYKNILYKIVKIDDLNYEKYIATKQPDGTYIYTLDSTITLANSTDNLELIEDGLITGTTYTKYVTALNSSGESTLTSATAIPDVPQAPSNLQVQSIGLDNITWSWDANINNSNIIKYHVIVKNPDNTILTDIYTTDATIKTHSENNLDINSTYTIEVKAVNSLDEEGYPATLATTTEQLLSPSNFIATAQSSSKILYSFDKYLSIELYYIYDINDVKVGEISFNNVTSEWETITIGDSLIKSYTSASPEFLVSSLSPNTTYSFKLKSVYDVDTLSSTFSSTSATTNDLPPFNGLSGTRNAQDNITWTIDRTP